jgi:two-component system, cell cycle response regulator DivK
MAGELILVVDDNALIRKLTRVVLEGAGFRTLQCGTVAEALSLAAEHLPALVLMDIQLPDGDGVTALQQLRGDPRTAAIPVVALTALAMRGDRERFLEAGFDGYIAKPIDSRAFPRQVSAYCGESASRE